MISRIIKALRRGWCTLTHFPAWHRYVNSNIYHCDICGEDYYGED